MIKQKDIVGTCFTETAFSIILIFYYLKQYKFKRLTFLCKHNYIPRNLLLPGVRSLNFISFHK